MKIQSNSTNSLSLTPSPQNQAPEEFEAVFLRKLLKDARSVAQSFGPEKKDSAQEMYESLLDDQLATVLAEQRTFGIANEIENWLKDNQLENK